jgi:hypothetical protein
VLKAKRSGAEETQRLVLLAWAIAEEIVRLIGAVALTIGEAVLIDVRHR